MKKNIKVIAEIAQGFEGDLTKSKLFIKAAASAGADAVKFQLVYSDELATESYEHYNLFKSLEMPDKCWKEINKYSSDLGIELILDIFGPRSLETTLSIGLKTVKIHGTDITNLDLLTRVSSSKIKSVILGIGGASMKEIKDAVNILNKKDLILLLGFQGYPTKTSDNMISRLNIILKNIKKIHNNFTIGFASHPDEKDHQSHISLVAIGAGAKVIERHLTLGKVMKLEDYESALNPDEFLDFVKVIKSGYNALGNSSFYNLSSSEKKYRKAVRRDIVASMNIKKGTKLLANHLYQKRTGISGGLKNLNQAYGKILQVDLKKDDIILKSYIK